MSLPTWPPLNSPRWGGWPIRFRRGRRYRVPFPWHLQVLYGLSVRLTAEQLEPIPLAGARPPVLPEGQGASSITGYGLGLIRCRAYRAAALPRHRRHVWHSHPLGVPCDGECRAQLADL